MEEAMKIESYKLFLEVQEGKLTPEQAQTELLKLLKCEKNQEKATFLESTAYDGENILKCPSGLYMISWKAGGSSLASIGVGYDNSRWLAPTNWVNPHGLAENADRISKIIPIQII